MKQLIVLIAVFVSISSCSSISEKQDGNVNENSENEAISSADTITESTTNQSGEYSEYESESNEIPPNGRYHFDVSFSEWQGQSMGEKVIVVINGNSVKVIYDRAGKLEIAEKDVILTEGQLMKHKSGRWIITDNPDDVQSNEVGGCTDGPPVIDFKNKKYWMC